MTRMAGRYYVAIAALLPRAIALSGKGFGSAKTSPFTHQPTCQSLVDHLVSQKAILAGVEVGVSGNSRRGLFATKNISQGSTICKIPSDLALALSDPAEPDDNLVRCGLNYLKQYDKAENWRWYTETFPEELPLTPDAFGDDEMLELLEFPVALERIRERQKDLQTVASGETGFSIEELQRATTLVSSRSFPLSVAEDNGDINLDDRGQVVTKAGSTKAIRVLVPLIDMANHRSTNFNAKLVLQDAHKDDAWFVLEATRNIRQGQEITMSYGAADSVDLLLNYGFTDDGNPVDAYMLRKHVKDFPLEDWSTTLDEDMSVLEMLGEDLVDDHEDRILRMVLKFRKQLKQSYANL